MARTDSATSLAKSGGPNSQAAKLTSPVHFLTDRQALFVDLLVKGKPPVVAARLAGYASPETMGTVLSKQPKVQAAVRYLYGKHEKLLDISRKRVLEGFMEAIEMAKVQADPREMISGWREIGRMCGYYAPEVKKVDITVTSKRVIDRLETLSDDELLRLVDESQQTIEAEAVSSAEELQEVSDAAYAKEFGE